MTQAVPNSHFFYLDEAKKCCSLMLWMRLKLYFGNAECANELMEKKINNIKSKIFWKEANCKEGHLSSLVFTGWSTDRFRTRALTVAMVTGIYGSTSLRSYYGEPVNGHASQHRSLGLTDSFQKADEKKIQLKISTRDVQITVERYVEYDKWIPSRMKNIRIT